MCVCQVDQSRPLIAAGRGRRFATVRRICVLNVPNAASTHATQISSVPPCVASVQAVPSAPSSRRTALQTRLAPDGIAAGRNIGTSRYAMPTIIMTAQPMPARWACAIARWSGETSIHPLLRPTADQRPSSAARITLPNASPMCSATAGGTRAVRRPSSTRPPTQASAARTSRAAVPTMAYRPSQKPATMPAVPVQYDTAAATSPLRRGSGSPSASGPTMYSAPTIDPEIHPSVSRCVSAIIRGW